VLVTAVAAVVAVAALLATIGADARWLAALGHSIATHGSIPSGIPFAAAPTAHWPNAVALAELVFNGLEQAFGDRGLVLAQLLCVGGGFAVLARDARLGRARVSGTTAALLLAALGTLPSLAIVRVQMFSLLLFPVLVALLRAESRRPSWRIWLLLPLLALWSNLHGVALLGLVVALAYLLLVRARQQPLLAVAVAIAAPIALCLTPAGLGTITYYHGVLVNVAAQRGQGMWGPISIGAPFDIVLVACALALAVKLRQAGPAFWEVAVAVVLGVLTLHASRNGVWLLLFLAPPAARALKPVRTWVRLLPVVALSSALALGFALARGPVSNGASPALLSHAIALADGSPVLAAGGIEEQVALAGGRIWAGDPIDAFSHSDQATYLDFVAGAPGGRRALSQSVRVVLVTPGSAAQRLMERMQAFVAAGGDGAASLYVRRGA
jgi:hypothetical protein